MQPAIKLKNVSKRFGSKNALSQVSLEVPAGSIFGFLGPNGAGKTTSIRCIMDFMRPDSGQITVLGKDANSASQQLKRSIGYLPAATNLYDNWTSAQHIQFASSLRGLKYDTSLAKKLSLSLEAKVGSLSTGNRQKLMIVLAWLGKPELLILDEPTKGLDPILQGQLYDMISEHKDRGGTVFMSSHNLPEVEKICDSIAVIREGRLIVEETMESLHRKSIHHVSATFKDAVNPATFDLANVEIVRSTTHYLDLKVKGNVEPIVKAITKHSLLDLEVTHATLEELFMEMNR